MSPYNCQEDTRLTAPGRAAPNSPISLNKGLAVSVKGLWWHYWGLWWWGSNEAPGGFRCADGGTGSSLKPWPPGQGDGQALAWVPLIKSCGLLLLYTQAVVFGHVCSGGILDGTSAGWRKLEVGSFGEKQSNRKMLLWALSLYHYDALNVCLKTTTTIVKSSYKSWQVDQLKALFFLELFCCSGG